ncbi:hypothetical protein DCO58_06870 [Helicobacter saguini]|uniref:Uncharacterized protein n=1 Tax=Helicobacter saguini TaxID=1548018 RepID=A0A347VN12_9HELI|nr:hypothetical protein [Helicobacter saguini]MWV61944.1 hypothetical protein [Helicobacter saguini]MWV67381.1 hypothetical protein [Helicobacter saguini]MWV69734.1 hypothetical protein [Helicobacter saguini]MWV73049.1 hypothetical protein [Helicobacter saguini]TLD95576.1 hypothetical protein LS64_001590 [Helicobacter saguini]
MEEIEREFYLKKIIAKEQLAFIQNLFRKEDLSSRDFWRKENGALRISLNEVRKLYDFLSQYNENKAKGKKKNILKALSDIEYFFNAKDKAIFTQY